MNCLGVKNETLEKYWTSGYIHTYIELQNHKKLVVQYADV